VVGAIRDNTDAATLAVGDGANDVPVRTYKTIYLHVLSLIFFFLFFSLDDPTCACGCRD
jgi:hypothetical protein